ncbi:hypothetical protein [Novipirellula artificiosorum]|uniref:Uncharacterized protein n=1 Tax=Novipirellula artificiosorum TaxID=2528016 RepID=A0A5C6E245_9BACT|nr:hypothetical protein [Novipirellula artificiosorum]TWU42554.1 hypothetical protein Poly41_08510 [Novipirellula artificiosorum]
MNESSQHNLPIVCLRLGAFLCFAGWTWVHFYWEGPYGVLVWQDSTYELATQFGISWDEFVGSGANDGFVQKWISRIWWLYLACTVLTVTVRKKSWIQMSGLVLGSGLLTLLCYAKYVGSQRQLPMFVEHGGQMLIPILLVMALALGVRHRITVITAIIALIMTFAGHGSYALGLWPTPGNYYAMTSVILGLDYPTAQAHLRAVGVLDFLICIGIFIPYLRRASALYATVWGFLTSIARPVAGMSWGLNYWGADQFLHEAVLRAPHFLIPLYLLLIWRKPRPTESPEFCPHSQQDSGVSDRPVAPEGSQSPTAPVH